MANTQHNTELDDTAKQILPEGHRLSSDRGKQAQETVDSVSEWKRKGTNKVDLKGFDTPDMKEKAARRILFDDGVGYVRQEVDRFMRADQEAFQLLQRGSKDFQDYESFKRMVNDKWGQDTSLKRLLDHMNENDYKSLFNHEIAQSWLRGNIEDTAVTVLMRKHNIELETAKKVWDRMPQTERGQLLTSIIKGHRLKPKTSASKRPTLTKEGKVKFIQQTSRRGRSYQRSKPQKWTEMQENFLKNNRDKGSKWLMDFHNRIFDANRSQTAIKSKLYRLTRKNRKK